VLGPEENKASIGRRFPGFCSRADRVRDVRIEQSSSDVAVLTDEPGEDPTLFPSRRCGKVAPAGQSCHVKALPLANVASALCMLVSDGY
jgi:hypothetical protein